MVTSELFVLSWLSVWQNSKLYYFLQKNNLALIFNQTTQSCFTRIDNIFWIILSMFVQRIYV